jgi:DNA repair exonuclease SbcCD ATPase subunit
MKEVIFKTLSIKNFLSVGDESIDIKFETGLHIITGINKDKEDGKNGVGKSTIIDAFFFVLYGSPLRPIKKDSLINWITKKGCSVTTTFNVINDGKVDEYTLLRALGPSRIQLIKNGEDISRTIGKTHDNISEILGTTSEMLAQSVITCLNETEPFLSKTPAVKRKFIEDAYNIEIFGQMTTFIGKDFNATRLLYNSELEKISDIESTIQLHKKQEVEQVRKKTVRINELEARKTSIAEEIVHLTKKIDEINNMPSDGKNKDELVAQIAALKAKEREVIEADKLNIKALTINQTIILNVKNEIRELEKVADGMCVYCKQPFSESNKEEKRKLIAEKHNDIKVCTDIIVGVEEKIKHTQKQKDAIEDLIEKLSVSLQAIIAEERQVANITTELKQQEKQLKQTIGDIENVSTDSVSFDNIISELTARKDALQASADAYKTKLSLIESCKFVVSDEGVKSIIIKKMLKMLNGRLNYYLIALDAPGSCQFDEYFDETIINNRGKECSYYNFSSGERKRFDLGMMYTFKDIRKLQSNVFINVGMYDELLDTALDANGIELALNILKERVIANKEAIYVISHKKEAAKHATGEVIYLEKENDITKRKPYEYSAISAS